MTKVTPENVNVPALEIDAKMARLYGQRKPLNGTQRNERRIVAYLCAALAEQGWTPTKVYDSETDTPATDTKAVMELVFNLDEAWVFFGKDGNEHYVYLVCGNDDCIISDWTFSRKTDTAPEDADGFGAALDAISDAIQS